jgi:hypothetical protein
MLSRAADPNAPASGLSPARPAAYSGPSLGTILWTGIVEQNGTITIDGNRVSPGSMTGGLPGVPVQIELVTRDVAVAEAPGPGNGWRRLVIRSGRRQTEVSLRWNVLR